MSRQELLRLTAQIKMANCHILQHRGTVLSAYPKLNPKWVYRITELRKRGETKIFLSIQLMSCAKSQEFSTLGPKVWTLHKAHPSGNLLRDTSWHSGDRLAVLYFTSADCSYTRSHLLSPSSGEQQQIGNSNLFLVLLKGHTKIALANLACIVAAEDHFSSNHYLLGQFI